MGSLSSIYHLFTTFLPTSASLPAAWDRCTRGLFGAPKRRWLAVFTALSLLGQAGLHARPIPSTDDELAEMQKSVITTFQKKIVPFLKTYCGDCHGEKKQKGGLTFRYANKNPSSPAFRDIWKQSAAIVKAHDMPPEEAKQHPSEAEVTEFIDWVSDMKFLSPKDPGPFVIRRLNKIEYGNTLRDFLGVDPELTRELPDEVFGAGYLNSLSPLLIEQYLSIANKALDQALAPAGAPPTPIQKRLFGPAPAPGTDVRNAARGIAQKLARIAYRRPAAPEEIDVLLQVFDLAGQNGKNYTNGLRLMLKAILVSPQFLFITPGTEPESGKEIVTLDDHHLASRLSYFLWSTMPDAELGAIADAGELRKPEVLAAQVRRMLKDSRSRALFDGFGAQWLGLDKLATKTFDAAKFPEMTPKMRASMYDEARLFFESIVRENRSVTSFILSDYTYLNETLASLYGMSDVVKGPKMQRVKLTDPNRGGILGMPGTLASSSFPDRTSPVNRGVWVLEQLLGEHVPPPPADVPTLEQQAKADVKHMTLRQRTELHRTDPVCANCHKILDPIGFGLENFDAIGRWRSKDENGGAIDAAGELPGEKHFSSPKELKNILGTRIEDLCRNLTEKLLSYALCRPLEGYDEIVASRLTNTIVNDGNRMQTLIIQVVSSYPFTNRRIQEQPTKSTP